MPGGRTPEISLAALRLHAQGLLASFEQGCAGFVRDGYLDHRDEATQLAVVELCLAGVWRRAPGGYRIVSSEALRMAGEVHREVGDPPGPD